jgi:hypothetical protein
MARNEGPMPLISTYDYNVSLLRRAAKERSDSLPSRSKKSMALE